MAKGISRKREKRAKAGEKTPGFVYFGPDGKRITARATIERCNKLAIPPAWKDVWISPRPRADLQATGRDAKGRLQYRYHKNWTDARAAEKFDGMTAFAAILPSIRKRIHLDLAQEGMPKSKVVALVIKLIDLYHFRIGNDEYAKMNRSYGLTTLTEGHMTIDRSSRAEGKLDAIFEFAGKSGKLWRKRIWEDDIAQLIVASGRVGGRDENQDLFRYEDESRRDHDIKAFHINEYLDASTGDARRVTAKDFRTWAATWKATFRLSEQVDPDSATARKRVAAQVVKTVASDLGNTPAVCRSSYIHPAILSDWTDGTFRRNWNGVANQARLKGLSSEEGVVLRYLKKR